MDSSLILETYCYESGDLSNAFENFNAGGKKLLLVIRQVLGGIIYVSEKISADILETIA